MNNELIEEIARYLTRIEGEQVYDSLYDGEEAKTAHYAEFTKDYYREHAREIIDICREETSSILGPSYADDVFGFRKVERSDT